MFIVDESDIDRGECFESVGKAMVVYLILVKEIGLTYIPFVLRFLIFFLFPNFTHVVTIVRNSVHADP